MQGGGLGGVVQPPERRQGGLDLVAVEVGHDGLGRVGGEGGIGQAVEEAVDGGGGEGEGMGVIIAWGVGREFGSGASLIANVADCSPDSTGLPHPPLAPAPQPWYAAARAGMACHPRRLLPIVPSIPKQPRPPDTAPPAPWSRPRCRRPA